MDHLLNLSTAAKLVGVSRGTLQKKIQSGELETFEGHIRISSLCKVYPEVENKTDPVLERVNRIRDNPAYKPSLNERSDKRLLADQIHQLQIELKDTYAELDTYKRLVQELHDRMTALKDGCNREEKQQLQALMNWMSSQL